MKTNDKNEPCPAAQPARPEPKKDTPATLNRDQWIARALAAATRHKKEHG